MEKAPSSRVEMLPAQRQARIIETLENRGAASIQQLADALGASGSTVRRDLDALNEQGFIERTHGGAVVRRPPTTRFEPAVSIAAHTASAQKSAIARVAAHRINAGQSVIFDSSSTVAAAAAEIVRAGVALTAVTNGLHCAAQLAGAASIHTIVIGGAIRPGTMTLVGELGRNVLSQIRADIAFIGAHAITGATLTETSIEVAAMKRLMIDGARRVVVLADSGKFVDPTFCEVCRAERIDELITDEGASDDQLRELRAAGVTCTRVNASGAKGAEGEADRSWVADASR